MVLLFVAIEGEEEAISIEIAPGDMVAHLKKLVYRECEATKKPSIQITTCWKLDPPVIQDDYVAYSTQIGQITQDLHLPESKRTVETAKWMADSSRIEKHFPSEPQGGHVHVLMRTKGGAGLNLPTPPPLALYVIAQDEKAVLEIHIPPDSAVAALEDAVHRKRREKNLPPIQIDTCWKLDPPIPHNAELANNIKLRFLERSARRRLFPQEMFAARQLSEYFQPPLEGGCVHVFVEPGMSCVPSFAITA
ncbi:hypothetical protein BOTBODRAFT_265433 [Botryobasidium botryosum FD-172 SS1]|uniref:Crinkler effector protein N-terminal domain-containing protein n=1 Tax=Botryobasidium botryosum (strain FD-172 SS1) TaxID=930990 RepID=A0A067M2M4_BOTB1|nr:hypothetical protein BOTBODRAFT_265433 [Botryobasidium botryosum FD-172 SS1]